MGLYSIKEGPGEKELKEIHGWKQVGVMCLFDMVCFLYKQGLKEGVK